jgi:lipopolysaccharide transport system ATP-binding protein
MSNTIIQVEHISKSYILKHQGSQSYTALRDVITNKAKSIFNSKSQILDSKSEEFWALNDVSFEIKQGDRVGIIGRNGAGKSTLLKVLSRIVMPTKGRITIDGRIASLLEVGTGFHPELTGRENVFLNGSILGMTKAEIKKKFDEIVAFAEVEKFLDTPVKRYSSGMYVRLAFAVAAHLEPEILIVDEVLAVGDAEFQKKCLGKMKDVSGEGRTVLFVSHNMAAIQNLCDKAIYLKNGQVQLIGESDKVISTYLKAASEISSINLKDRKDRSGNGSIRFTSVVFKDGFENKVQALQCGAKGIIEIAFEQKNKTELNNLHISMGIDDEYGQRITQLSNEATNQLFQVVNSNASVIQIHMNKIPLKQGRYSFVLYSTVNNELADWIQEAGSFDVEAGDFYNTGKLLPDGQGNFYIDHSFQLK